MVDILVLNYNSPDLTVEFVNSIYNYSSVGRIIVVDNASTDNSLTLLKEQLSLEKIHIVSSNKNGGYGAGNNVGIKYASEKLQSDYLLLCNPDIKIENDVILGLENFIRSHEEYGLAAARMLDAKGNYTQNTARKIPALRPYLFSPSMIFSKYHPDAFLYSDIDLWKEGVYDVDIVSGSCFMLDVTKFIEVGMFDENIFLYGEELVIGKRMKDCNYKVGFLPSYSFLHVHSASISRTYSSEISRWKISMRSKRYILNAYYKINSFQKFVLEGVIAFAYLEILARRVQSRLTTRR